MTNNGLDSCNYLYNNLNSGDVEMVDAINRSNWREYKKEPYLSKDEYALWLELAGEILKDDSLFDYIIEQTESEYNESESIPPTTDWSDLVKSSDARCRLDRAEIKAYKQFLIDKEIM